MSGCAYALLPVLAPLAAGTYALVHNVVDQLARAREAGGVEGGDDNVLRVLILARDLDASAGGGLDLPADLAALSDKELVVLLGDLAAVLKLDDRGARTGGGEGGHAHAGAGRALRERALR